MGKNYGLGRRGDLFGKGQANFVNLLRAYMCFIDDMYSFIKDDLYICPKEIRIRETLILFTVNLIRFPVGSMEPIWLQTLRYLIRLTAT